ncbi:MAG: CBS domain-containing protein [Candidatus Hydrogenedentes bacterium]|nr:CBS domain-containing protein [Candidatus Hydrogenedentota bacterium]
MITIRDIIKNREPFWVSAEDNVRQVAKHLCKLKTGAVAIKDGVDVIGVFSERDLMHRVVCEGLDPGQVPVREVMSTDLTFIHIDDDIRLAKALMHKARVRHLLVVGKDQSYRGMVSIRDIIEADVAGYTELVQKLNDTYYQQAYQAKYRLTGNRVIVEPYVAHG